MAQQGIFEMLCTCVAISTILIYIYALCSVRTDSLYFLVPEIREFASVVAAPAFVCVPSCRRTMFIIILVDLDPP